ncbi:MAG TPA: DUF2905 domain-containing protein [Lacipirellulaceae bacterium]|nr:DUF2905 domain-containing protein [Lacipirellulaceae bacterium]
MNHPALALIVIGAILVVCGVVWMLAPSIPWLGHLPGDIRWEGAHGSFYFPITTCLVLSLLLSAALWLIRQLWR